MAFFIEPRRIDERGMVAFCNYEKLAAYSPDLTAFLGSE